MPSKARPRYAKKGKRPFKKYAKKRRSGGSMMVRSPRADYTTTFRTANDITMFNSTLINAGYAFAWSFNDAIGVIPWSPLFDYYRINYVTMKFTPVATESNSHEVTASLSGSGQQIPNYVVCIDRDDAIAPSSATGYLDLRQRQGSITKKATRSHYLKIRPTRLNQVFRSTLTTGYVIDKSREFLDMNQPDVPHYGVKFSMESASPANIFAIRVEMSLNISFSQRIK